jgi:hypothetical protein
MDRIQPSGWTALLAVGDLVAVGLFVIGGEFQHYGASRALLRAPETAFPFLVGLALAGTLAGMYRPAGREDVSSAAVHAAAGWVGAVVVGQALRATAFFHGDFSPAFAVVSLLVGGGLVVGWRVTAARLFDTGG